MVVGEDVSLIVNKETRARVNSGYGSVSERSRHVNFDHRRACLVEDARYLILIEQRWDSASLRTDNRGI